MPTSRFSVVVATYNMRHLIRDTIESIKDQNFPDLEIIVYDDCSTDSTDLMPWSDLGVKYIRGNKNVGVGEAFNRGIEASEGKYVMLMCADDLFATREYIPDVARIFDTKPKIGYVTRWYYQFISPDHQTPVRAWRGNNPLILANNPSGLAFRREALLDCHSWCSNKMFVETTALASQVIREGWHSQIVRYDAIAVRVHASTSTNRTYWKERRVSSPVLDWAELGAKDIAKDYVSFVQIRNGLGIKEVWEEVINFAGVRPLNMITPQYYFWALVALLTPRCILVHLPNFYRKHIGRRLTRVIRRREH